MAAPSSHWIMSGGLVRGIVSKNRNVTAVTCRPHCLQTREGRVVVIQCHPATLNAFGGIQSFNAHLLMKCLSVDTCGYFHCGSLDSKICLVITRMSQTGGVCVCVCVFVCV